MFSVNVGSVVHEDYGQQGQNWDDMRVAGALIVSFTAQIETGSIKSVNGCISMGSLESDNILLRNNVRNIEKLFATAKPSLMAEASAVPIRLAAGMVALWKVYFHPGSLGEGVTSVNYVLITGSPPSVSQGLLKNLNNRKNVRESRHHEERSDFKSGP